MIKQTDCVRLMYNVQMYILVQKRMYMCGFACGALSNSKNTERNFHFFGVEGYNLLVAIEASLDAGEEVTQLGFFTSPGAFNGGRTLRGKESLNTGNECFSESQTIWSPIFTHRSLITTKART